MENLLQPQNIRSGIAEYFLLAPVSWFLEIKDPLSGTTIITDTHAFLPGKAWVKIVNAPEKNSYSMPISGEPGFYGLTPTLNVFIPGSYPEAQETLKYLLNVPLIALAKDSNCAANFYYQLGSSADSAWITGDFSTGTTNNGNKGITAKVVQYAGSPIIYTGDVVIVNPEDLFIVTEDGQFILTEDGQKILMEN